MKKNLIIWSVLTLMLTLFAAPFAKGVLYPGMAFVTPYMSTEGIFSVATFTDYYEGLVNGANDLFVFFILFCAAGLVIAIYMAFEEAKHINLIAEDSVLGTSSIIETPKERRKHNDAWNGKGTPKTSGLVYGFENGRYLYDSKTPHQMCVARTGGGKSRYSMLQTLHLNLEAECNLIISDQKNEIIELTGDKAAEKSTVVLYDFEEPLKGNRYNPLDLIVEYADSGNIAKMADASDKLAANLIPLEEKILISATPGAVF